MYLVTLINNNIETAINEVSVSSNNRIKGTIKRAINAIDNFTFTILPNNDGYRLLNEYKTLVKVINTKNNKTVFEGRVLHIEGSMDSNGLIAKKVTCEGELGYLWDSMQRYAKIQNTTPKGLLELLINNHNKSVSDDKKFIVGEVNVTNSTDNVYRYLEYESTFSNILDKLVNRLGGELRIRKENGLRYLDWLTEIGETKDTTIKLAKNIKSISINDNKDNLISVLVPLGKKISIKEKNKDGQYVETETEERITIKSVNGGLDYLIDKNAMSLVGVKESSYILDDVEEPKNLLSKGKKYLEDNNKIIRSCTLDVLDLSLIGIDTDSIELYNTYLVYHSILNVKEYLRVIEESIDIENPHLSKFTFGAKNIDIKDYHKEANKQVKMVSELDKELKKATTKVETVKSELGNAIVKLDQDRDNLKEDIINIKNNIGNMDSELKDFVNELASFTIALSETVEELNKKVGGESIVVPQTIKSKI